MTGLPETTINFIILIIFAASSLIQLFYNLYFFSRVTYKKDRQSESIRMSEAVSVIICARNEALNLKSFLPSVLEQNYPNFEVIVVNDCSEDETEEVLKLMSLKYNNLKVTTIYKDSSLIHSKKMALFIGIKEAANDLLMLTDADCIPVSDKWISSITREFSAGKDFIFGYGGYLKGSGLLNRYIRYDTMTIAMQYLGMAKAGHPYMGVGRNLAYRKSLFFENRGFGSHMNLQSGDDDLFVNALATGKNSYAELNPDSFTISTPSLSWDSFKKQKLRHMSTSGYYRKATKFMITLEPVSRLLFYTMFAILISGMVMPAMVLPLFAITLITRILVLRSAQKALNERDLFLISPLFDIASIFINAIFLLESRINKRQNYEWK